MIRSLYRTQDGNVYTNLHIPDLTLALEDTNGLLWVDLDREPKDICKPILEEIFGFHHLAIDDALEEIHNPKVDDWGNNLYLVISAVDPRHEHDWQLNMSEVDAFLGNNYLVTYHSKPSYAVERLWDVCQRDERQLSKNSSYLLYKLIDEIATDYIAVAGEIDEAISKIEAQLFENPQPFILEKIFTLKRDLLHLRHLIAPQRDMINKLSRDTYQVLNFEAKVYFRDVYDHFSRLYDIVENLRELTGSALETYLSVINNRMNNVMKTLTVITTLFMPVSFIVGFFGMNFFQPTIPLTAWTDWPAFMITMLVIILLPSVMFLWMRYNKWME